MTLNIQRHRVKNQLFGILIPRTKALNLTRFSSSVILCAQWCWAVGCVRCMHCSLLHTNKHNRMEAKSITYACIGLHMYAFA